MNGYSSLARQPVLWRVRGPIFRCTLVGDARGHRAWLVTDCFLLSWCIRFGSFRMGSESFPVAADRPQASGAEGEFERLLQGFHYRTVLSFGLFVHISRPLHRNAVQPFALGAVTTDHQPRVEGYSRLHDAKAVIRFTGAEALENRISYKKSFESCRMRRSETGLGRTGSN